MWLLHKLLDLHKLAANQQQLITSFLYIFITTFPAIRWSTSPTPIGLRPGFLFRDINLHAIKASNDWFSEFTAEYFDNISYWFTKIAARNDFEVNICLHCVKSVQIQRFFWSLFSCIWTEYRDLLRKSPYSVRLLENTDQKNPAFGHFSRRAPTTFNDTCCSQHQFYIYCVKNDGMNLFYWSI